MAFLDVKKRHLQTVSDLEKYYATCGTQADCKRLQELKDFIIFHTETIGTMEVNFLEVEKEQKKTNR